MKLPLPAQLILAILFFSSLIALIATKSQTVEPGSTREKIFYGSIAGMIVPVLIPIILFAYRIISYMIDLGNADARLGQDPKQSGSFLNHIPVSRWKQVLGERQDAYYNRRQPEKK